MPLQVTTRRFLLLALVWGALTPLVLGLSTAEAEAAAATLVWSAPGDDGTVGRASQYDLRISQTAIAGQDTLSWWNAATVVDMSGIVPSTSGAADSVTVSGLTSGTTYYAIIRAADEVPNWSGFSNVAVIDLNDNVAPAPVADLRLQ